MHAEAERPDCLHALRLSALVKGDSFQFWVDQTINGRSLPVRYEGRIEGDRIVGIIADAQENKVLMGFHAERNPVAPVLPLDTVFTSG